MKPKWIFSLTLLTGLIVLLSFVCSSPAEAASQKTTVKYPSGAVYYGEVKGGKPNGSGKMTWSKAKVYEGQWVNGQRSGFGKYTETTKGNGTLKKLEYIGNWKLDKKEGQGTLLIKSTTDGKLAENSIQQGKFKKDRLVTGFHVRHGDFDPPYEFEYKDEKLLLHN